MAKRKTFDDYVLEGGVKGKHFIRGNGSTEGEVYQVVRAAKGHESFGVRGVARDEYFLVEYCYLKYDVEATLEEVQRAKEGQLVQKAQVVSADNKLSTPKGAIGRHFPPQPSYPKP